MSGADRGRMAQQAAQQAAAETADFEGLVLTVATQLKARGLEVVDMEWRGKTEAGGYLVIQVRRVFGPPLHPCGFCEHAAGAHDVTGCLVLDCPCQVYSPPLDGPQ